MALNPEITLAELVNTRPWIAPLLEANKLDYCCGGKTSLRDAVADSGAALDSVMSQIESTVKPSGAAEVDWTELGLTGLVDHLEATHHVYLRGALARLGVLADKVVDVHSRNHPELIRVREIFWGLRGELEPHLEKEETRIFPMIRQLDTAVAGNGHRGHGLGTSIRELMVEHENAAELLEEMRAVARDYALPSDACASYTALYQGLAELESDTHMHVHKENNLLIPSVERAERDLAKSSS